MTITLLVGFVLLGHVSLRSSVRVLGILAKALGWDWRIPHWSTVRLWLQRMGLHQLRLPKERGGDWAWLIDHSVQIGVHKVLLIVGVRLNQLKPGQRLCLEDLSLITLAPMASSTAQQVHQQLDAAMAVTGPPRQIVDDHGADLCRGVALLREQHPAILEAYDIRHKTALLLKGCLERDEQWKQLDGQVARTRCVIQQTDLAFLVPPPPRPKARFMSLGPLLNWAQKVLDLLRCPPPWLSEDQRRRMHQKLGWLEPLEASVQRWRECQQVAEVAVQQVECWGLHAGAAAELERELSPLLAPMPQRCSGRDLAAALVGFVAEQSAAAAEGERLLGSTAVLESLFGKFKVLEGQQAQGGYTQLVLSMGALVCPGSGEGGMAKLAGSIQEALTQTPAREVPEWCRQHLGPTLHSQRKQAFQAATAAQQKPDQGGG